MVSASTLVQSNGQRPLLNICNVPTQSSLTALMPYQPYHALTQASLTKTDSPNYRQWPYRSFAFASDLGLIGYLVKQPVLGTIGWMIALPYYACALLHQEDTQKRKEEGIYQATANGLFPFIEAKFGVKTGGWLAEKLSHRFAAKYPTSELRRLPRPMYKGIGGLLALLVLTPTLGDPLSHWLLEKYQKRNRPGDGRKNP